MIGIRVIGPLLLVSLFSSAAVADDYSDERKNPDSPYCGYHSLFFDGESLWFDFDFKKSGRPRRYPAVSGKPNDLGTELQFTYDTASQMIERRGPIPEGVYWINPDEMWNNAWYKQGSTTAWGDHRLSIHPFPGTETFGRGGFFVHGGCCLGSAGCIDLTKHMNAFYIAVSRRTGLKNCHIHLWVSYKDKRLTLAKSTGSMGAQ